MTFARKMLLTLCALVVSAVLGYVLVALMIFGAWELTGFRDRDGGAGMAVVYVLAPICGLIAGLAGATVTAIHLSRKTRNMPMPAERVVVRDQKILLRVLCAIGGVFAGWQLANLARSLLRPFIFEHYVFVTAHAATHYVLPIVCAAIGFYLGGRIKRII